MYIAVTGSKNNKDVYIYQSFRKKDGKSSSRIYKKLGKYNTLLEQFDGDNEKLMAWAKIEAAKETALYNERTGKVTVEFSQAACIPMNEARSFHAGYLFLQQLCTELRIDNICRVIKGHHKFKYDFHAILTDLVYARVKLFVQGNLQIGIYRKLNMLPMLYQDTSQFLLLFAFRVYNVNPATVLAFQFTLEESLHSTSADYTIGYLLAKAYYSAESQNTPLF